MKKVQSKFVVAVLVALACAATANAIHTTVVAIQEGVTGSDGWAMWDGSISSTSGVARVGYNANGWSGTAQFYFKIPDALKVPGVTILSANLYLETKFGNAGNTGYGGTYVQLMKYAYDCNTVSVAQASGLFTAPWYGTPDESKFTRIGGPVFRVLPPVQLSDFQYNWNVKTQLQASINAGWAYLPFAVMTTRSDGTFYANPYEVYGSGPEPSNFFNTYEAMFWTYEATNDPNNRTTPKITITYALPGELATDFWTVDHDSSLYWPGGDPDDPNYELIQMEDGAGSSDHNAIDYVMDLGQVTSFKAVGIQNRCVYASTGNPARAKIFVAVDESAPGFNPNDANGFTVQINVARPIADRFSPDDVHTAGVQRYIDVLDGYARRYVRVKITENASGPITVSNPRVQFQALLSSTEHKGTYTTAGRLFGLQDGVYTEDPAYLDEAMIFTYNEQPAVRFIYNGGPDGDMRADVVVDQLSVKDIQKVFFTNWLTENTRENVRLLSMWVAPASGPGSESDPNWDSTLKFKKSSYSVQIYPRTGGGEGVPQPETNSAGAIREAMDVNNLSRQYVLISVRSSFWGDVGQFDELGNYIYYVSFGDIKILGPNSIGTCDDAIRLGLTLPADMNKDCHVNMLDLKQFAQEWLQCTTPGAAGCVETPGAIPTYTITPVPSGGITVNGNLNEWPADSEWIYLTKLYAGAYPYDVKEAKMSLRWDGIAHKIYAAVIVDDPDHHFLNDPNFAADLIEVYSQGDVAGGTGWGAGSTNKYFDAAQQYIVGKKNTTGSWAAWADKSAIAGDAGFESAVTLNGDKIIYEIGVKQFNNYGGKSGGTTEVTSLAAGTIVGFDIIADTLFGSGSFSMISENMFTGKSDDAGQFQQYTLANSLPVQYCGDWGYMTSDVTQDCRVTLADFAAVALQWLNCNDPQGDNCTHNW